MRNPTRFATPTPIFSVVLQRLNPRHLSRLPRLIFRACLVGLLPRMCIQITWYGSVAHLGRLPDGVGCHTHGSSVVFCVGEALQGGGRGSDPGAGGCESVRVQPAQHRRAGARAEGVFRRQPFEHSWLYSDPRWSVHGYKSWMHMPQS